MDPNISVIIRILRINASCKQLSQKSPSELIFYQMENSGVNLWFYWKISAPNNHVCTSSDRSLFFVWDLKRYKDFQWWKGLKQRVVQTSVWKYEPIHRTTNHITTARHLKAAYHKAKSPNGQGGLTQPEYKGWWSYKLKGCFIQITKKHFYFTSLFWYPAMQVVFV